jgi:hypothetical protein
MAGGAGGRVDLLAVGRLSAGDGREERGDEYCEAESVHRFCLTN